MKPNLFLFAVSSLLICNIAIASEGLVFVYQSETFEGEKATTIETTIHYGRKGIRMEHRALAGDTALLKNPSVTIISSDTRDAIALLPGEKKYFRMKLDKMKLKKREMPLSSFERTGFKRFVGGKVCEVYRWRNADGIDESCFYTDPIIDKKLQKIERAWKKQGIDFSSFLPEYAQEQKRYETEGYVLEAVGNDSKGGITTVKLLKVNSEKLSDNLFQPPIDYSEIDLKAEELETKKRMEELRKTLEERNPQAK